MTQKLQIDIKETTKVESHTTDKGWIEMITQSVIRPATPEEIKAYHQWEISKITNPKIFLFGDNILYGKEICLRLVEE